MKETTKRVTLVDISKKTGYSVNCVSRALMDANDISAATKAKIKEVANELGYVQNLAAASLVKGRLILFFITVPPLRVVRCGS